MSMLRILQKKNSGQGKIGCIVNPYYQDAVCFDAAIEILKDKAYEKAFQDFWLFLAAEQRKGASDQFVRDSFQAMTDAWEYLQGIDDGKPTDE